jgi:hypothetical protein
MFALILLLRMRCRRRLQPYRYATRAKANPKRQYNHKEKFLKFKLK